MHKKTKLLYATRILGFLSFIIWCISLSPPSWRWIERLCSNNDNYGGLFTEAKVSLFKERLPSIKILKPTHPSTVDSYQVFAMGDSFLYSGRGEDFFLTFLSKELNEPIHLTYWDFPRPLTPSPVCIFKNVKETSVKQPKRIVIMECVERYIMERFLTIEDCPSKPKSFGDKSIQGKAETFFRWISSDKHEKRVGFLLYNSNLTTPIIERWNTWRFNLFRIIADGTPAYSISPPFLFTYQEILPSLKTSYYYPHNLSQIKMIAENIQAMQITLKSKYNADLIFLPIPNQYTICHKIINHDPYDNFLPRLYAELHKRNVNTIQLYETFMQSSDYPYYSTDTHWNGLGISLAVKKTVEAIVKINLNKQN